MRMHESRRSEFAIKKLCAILCAFIVSALLTSCTLDQPTPTVPAITALPTETPIPPMPTAPPFTDAAPIVAGICFEAALDAAGRVFVLDDAESLIRFYDMADNSRLCRGPVVRAGFEFDNGQVLVGLWSAGTGCTARHTVRDSVRDDSARRITLALDFITEGDCNYELVRPFWIAIEGAAGYSFDVTVDDARPPAPTAPPE